MSSTAMPLNVNSPETKSSLTLCALGVVFGDIGTSPLYTLRECLKAAGGTSEATVFGIVSLILWAVILVVTVKYVILVMRADNTGEGGILALTAMASEATSGRLRQTLLMLGVFGAAMFYGDSMITPAISVISAIEGATLINAHVAQWVVPASLVVLAVLFGMQKYGTAVVGRLFGPVMLVWFSTLALLGLAQIIQAPGILRAASPTFAIAFVLHVPMTAFVVLGSVFLALTGAEALYADMGHFGKAPVRSAWIYLVFPSLVLNYFGQAAFVLSNPTAISQPFFATAPGWALVPLVVLATAATVIASQAVISGAFSMTKQGVQLGILPRVFILHTSRNEIGQIYVPLVNLALFVAVVFLVVAFRSSDALASAYGIAVASTMLLTSVLMWFVMRLIWRWPLWLALLVAGAMFLLDAMFALSNLQKVLEGGWFPLIAGAALFVVMSTWLSGREVLAGRGEFEGEPKAALRATVTDASATAFRVEGTAVFIAGASGVTHTAFFHNLKHNGVMHKTNLFLTSSVETTPYVSSDKRASVEDLGSGCYAVSIRRGFMESPDIPTTLQTCVDLIPGWRYEPQETSFFLARETIVTDLRGHGLSRWRKSLFAFLARNVAHAAEYYSLPANRVVEMGEKVSV